MQEVNAKVKKGSYLIPEEIIQATLGLTDQFKIILLKIRKQENALKIANYILAMKHEINSSDNYRMSTIKVLAKLSNFYEENKLFSEITRQG
ncbi:MAG TPA: hypothetical protein VF220_09445, partial [Nitrososphaeraceae archaeon]